MAFYYYTNSDDNKYEQSHIDQSKHTYGCTNFIHDGGVVDVKNVGQSIRFLYANQKAQVPDEGELDLTQLIHISSQNSIVDMIVDGHYFRQAGFDISYCYRRAAVAKNKHVCGTDCGGISVYSLKTLCTLTRDENKKMITFLKKFFPKYFDANDDFLYDDFFILYETNIVNAIQFSASTFLVKEMESILQIDVDGPWSLFNNRWIEENGQFIEYNKALKARKKITYIFVIVTCNSSTLTI